MTNILQIRLKRQLAVPSRNGYDVFQAGDGFSIDVDENGTPLNHFWRRRFNDDATVDINNPVVEIITVDKKRKES